MSSQARRALFSLMDSTLLCLEGLDWLRDILKKIQVPMLNFQIDQPSGMDTGYWSLPASLITNIPTSHLFTVCRLRW